MTRRNERTSARPLLSCAGAATLILVATGAMAKELRLAEKGEARCVVVAPKGSLAWEGDTKPLPATWKKREVENRRRLLRDSICDLALYLGKMADAKVEIVEGPS